MGRAVARAPILIASLAVVVAAGARTGSDTSLASPIVWTIDSLSTIGGHAVTVVGAPRVVDTPVGRAVEFNGSSDGLLLDVNPLQGLGRFTIEVLFEPFPDGPEEQRFLHFEETGSASRALIELRRLPDGAWTLDTFLRHGAASLTLIDRSRTHPAGGWHVASLTFDGRAMTHAVDGNTEARGEVAFKPLGAGRTSIGMRQNRVSWFKGRIRQVRITPEAVIPLWPEGVPGARESGDDERVEDGRVYNVRRPSMIYVPPAAGAAASGTAVVICPGGSYARLALANEAEPVARMLSGLGVSTFILKYRLSEYGFPAPLQDALRAIRLLRSRAGEFGLRPDRIGVFGASAGGHVAAMAATLYDAPEGRTGSPLDATSARPDFVALLYPVVTMKEPFAHSGSRANLLGDRPSAALAERLSVETRVTSATPPAFLVHTQEDASVPVENSILLVQALRKAGVPVELHVYEKGPHGFGMTAGLGSASEWPRRFEEWLRSRGWLTRPGPSPPAAGQGRGFEGQRKADLGNGTYLNPILAGDHPDPSVLRDGDDYYMTFSSFDAYPGLVIWHSRDLVNWEPIGPALFRNVGSVWAPDLIKHGTRYYIYFPGIGPYRSNYVIWADDLRGPWSDPIDLKVGRIDPGHAVGPDGKRYLFLSGGYMAPLADDGLSVTAVPTKVYDGWKYPEEWIVEGFAQEGPKILKRGEYYHMVLAEGGTAGPPTGHMVVSARSRSIHGPWENSPYNPIIRTQSSSERWWSKGHGTLVEGRDGRWYIVYHAYENGFYTLGRQTLLEPIGWTADGWFRTAGHDPAKPIPKPAGDAVPHGFPYSDDFSTSRLGVQWSFYRGSESDRERYRYEKSSLVLQAKGKTPADSSPLWFVTGDHAYEVEVEIEADAGATAGLLLFYSSRLYAGLGFSAANLILHRYGTERMHAKPAPLGQRVFLRLRNDRHIVTMFHSADGRTWQRFENALEVSGYHHNVAYDFLSLRPALYAAGTGRVRFRNFKYRTLDP
ncbi:MAG TPA: family 43 glycosylhydrolase [Vicinamibacterales bacterium]|nr:family 43 glycosylhydrolase [Vicinamibacterales bacterium]